LKTDFLIIGSGIAGLSLGLKLSKLGNVVIVTKKQKAESNTNYAQGGIAAVLSEDDDFALHIKDTLECGAGLCDLQAVKKIVTEGPGKIAELINIGVEFTKKDGELELGKEGGHSKNRIVHSKDLTGKEVERALLKKISETPNIEIFEYYFAIDFLTHKNFVNHDNAKKNKCYGVYVFNVETNKIEKIISEYTIIASGGLGQVYQHTSNPPIATGDGIAMGYRAGCEIANLEFIQFHPTTLYEHHDVKSDYVFLITEAVRGAGAILRNMNGEDFMPEYDNRGSLAPRDIVARSIDNEMKKSGDMFVYLDINPIGLEKFKDEFPNIYQVCISKGVDLSKGLIPVVPAAHYSCGGIVTDLNGRTNIKNLYACGEVAMTGVHGANRLASNSLLEAMVFANAIYEDLNERVKDNEVKKHSVEPGMILDWNDEGTENAEEWILLSHNKNEIKDVMSDYVGIVRNIYRLERAMRRIDMMKDEIFEFYKKTKITVELLELRNLVTVAYLIIKSAMKRKESRGLHYMTDYPARDKKFLKDTVIKK
jgi:L-aspartate oxidase